MKKVLVLLILGLAFILPVVADTTYPSNARYVIVNPNGRLQVRTTFLLDTKTGRTWQLVSTSDGGNMWQQMKHDVYNQEGVYFGEAYKAPATTSP